MDPKDWKVTIAGETISWRLPPRPVRPVPPQVLEIQRAILKRLLCERPIRPA